MTFDSWFRKTYPNLSTSSYEYNVAKTGWDAHSDYGDLVNSDFDDYEEDGFYDDEDYDDEDYYVDEDVCEDENCPWCI